MESIQLGTGVTSASWLRGTSSMRGSLRKSEWRVANSEWRIGMGIEQSSDQFLPGPASMAGFHGVGGVVLSANPQLPEGRDVWVDVSNQAIGRFRSVQYRGGSWTGNYAEFHSIPPHRPRIAEGVGDAFVARGADRHGGQSDYRRAHGTVRGFGKNASVAHSLLATKRTRVASSEWRIDVAQNSARLLATRYSLFAIRYSLLGTSS